LSDLAVACYGDKAKLPMDAFVIAIQFSFLFAYNIFLGDQLDQILCKILMVAECGNSTMYKVLIDLVLLPFCLQKSLKNVAIFSMFALVTTLFSITIVFGLEGEIKSHSYTFI
jgi:amino acid permease